MVFTWCLPWVGFGQQRQLDSLEKILLQNRHDTLQINLLIQLSKGYLGKDNPRSASFAQMAKELAGKINRPKWKSIAFQGMSRTYKSWGRDSLAQSEAEKALAFSRQWGNRAEISNCLGLLGSIVEKYNIQKAIPLLEEKIRIDKQLNDPLRLSQAYSWLGDKLRSSSKNDQSLENFSLAYETLVKAGLKNKTGRALQGLAGQNYILGYYSLAVSMLNEAINLNKENKDWIAVGDNYNLMGVVYRKKGPIDSSIYWYNQCIGHFTKINELGRTQYPLNNLGNIYQDKKQYEKAIEYRRKSMAVYRETGQINQIGNVYTSLAYTYQDMKLWDKALTAIDSAYYFQKKYGVEWEARRYLYQTKYQVYENTGKLDSSLMYYKKYILIRDSIYGKETTEKMEKLRVQFETRQKEDQISLLQKENELRRKQADQQKLDLENARLLQLKTTADKQLLVAQMAEEKALRKEKEKQLEIEQLNENLISDRMHAEQQKRQILLKENQLKGAELKEEKLFRNLLLSLAFLVLAGAILIIYRIRIHQQKAKIATLTRIGRDLHDNIGSTLGSISVYSEMARNLKDIRPEMVGELLQKIQVNSRESVDTMSDIVWSLNPANETLEQLVMRLRNYATDVLVAQGIEVGFEMADVLESVKTSIEQRTQLFLILKEALFNASKYSKATKVMVECKKENGLIIWEVADNGIGFSAVDLQASRNGNGLRNMKLRAEEIGGKLRIDSQPGMGTRVILEWR